MTKVLLVGLRIGQPTPCRIFMLSHIPITPQWQRQKLANVHQGASLRRAAPLKLSSRRDRVRLAPGRHVGERETHTHTRTEKEGEKESRELTDFSKGAGSLYRAQQLMYICLCILTRASAVPPKINKFPRCITQRTIS